MVSADMDEKLPFTLYSDNFGAILNCAVRYALGRRTYIVSTVTDFIKPLVPRLNDTTLTAMYNDISQAKERFGGYGNDWLDKPKWMLLLDAVEAEITRREAQ